MVQYNIPFHSGLRYIKFLLALWLGYYFVQSSHFYLDGWQHSKKIT